jgi:DoxX-like family
MGRALWIVQGLLAVAFLFSGVSKLTAPADVLTALYPFPEGFMRFIGVCEALGALGLVLPGLLRLRTGLTPLAAAGLVIIMTGATLSTLAIGGGVLALMPLLLGILAAFVAYGRWQLAPLPEGRRSERQPAG